jgi:hypothetical protein
LPDWDADKYADYYRNSDRHSNGNRNVNTRRQR